MSLKNKMLTKKTVLHGYKMHSFFHVLSLILHISPSSVRLYVMTYKFIMLWGQCECEESEKKGKKAVGAHLIYVYFVLFVET